VKFDVAQNEGRLDALLATRTLGIIALRLYFDPVEVERLRRLSRLAVAVAFAVGIVDINVFVRLLGRMLKFFIL
jgi:hypothetical protein